MTHLPARSMQPLDPPPSVQPMRLSLATRIFLGYAVVLITFGAVSVFSVKEMHDNQQEIQLVSQGYLYLSQDIAAIGNFHKNQLDAIDRIPKSDAVEARRSNVEMARRYYPPVMAEHIATARLR